MFWFFSWFDLIYWMLYDYLSAHSPLTIGQNLVDEDDWWGWGWLKRTVRTLPLLGAADSETGRVVTPWRVMGGVKSIPRRTTYHRTSLPGFWVDGNKYILVQFLVCRISSLQVVDNVISSTRITGPLHHNSQLLFMITLFNQLWSVVIITNNSTNFVRERDESKN